MLFTNKAQFLMSVIVILVRTLDHAVILQWHNALLGFLATVSDVQTGVNPVPNSMVSANQPSYV